MVAESVQCVRCLALSLSLSLTHTHTHYFSVSAFTSCSWFVPGALLLIMLINYAAIMGFLSFFEASPADRFTLRTQQRLFLDDTVLLADMFVWRQTRAPKIPAALPSNC